MGGKKPLQVGQQSAVEEKSGIGGSMVRTGTRRATRGKQSEAVSHKAKLVVILMERAFNGEKHSYDRCGDVANKECRSETSERDRDGFSLAMAWSEEPEWQCEWSEVLSETAGGSREPEG